MGIEAPTEIQSIWEQFVQNSNPELRHVLITAYAPLVRFVVGRLFAHRSAWHGCPRRRPAHREVGQPAERQLAAIPSRAQYAARAVEGFGLLQVGECEERVFRLHLPRVEDWYCSGDDGFAVARDQNEIVMQSCRGEQSIDHR